MNLINCRECGKEINLDSLNKDYDNMVFCLDCLNELAEQNMKLQIDIEKYKYIDEKLSLSGEEVNLLVKKIDELILWVKNKKQNSTSRRRKRLPKEVRKFVLDKYEHKCCNCKREFPAKYLHVDHIKPLAKGGTNKLENLQLLCVECNLAKKDYWVGDTLERK